MGTDTFSLVFQNIDGDGMVTQTGDIVAVVEARSDKAGIRKLLPWKGWHRFLPKDNYRLELHFNPEIFEPTARKLVPVHKAGKLPPTPRRDWLVQDGLLLGKPTRFMVGHAVNSAWSPGTNFVVRRRSLWGKWFFTAVDLIDEGKAEGMDVYVFCDHNRARGRWNLPGVRWLLKHSTDGIFTSDPDALLAGTHIGAKTGDGRVTHSSLKVDIKRRG